MTDIKIATMKYPLGWWAGTSEEFMNIGGPFTTRDEAIAEGRHCNDGDPFWIVEASLANWRAPSASSVLDMIIENADELFYEDGFDGEFDGGKDALEAAENDLQTVLNEWFLRHLRIFPTPTAFGCSGPSEQIDAPVEAEEVEDQTNA